MIDNDNPLATPSTMHFITSKDEYVNTNKNITNITIFTKSSANENDNNDISDNNDQV